MEVPQVLRAIMERPDLVGPPSSATKGLTQEKWQRTGFGRKELLPLEPSGVPSREDILLSSECLPGYSLASTTPLNCTFLNNQEA